jgi:hypothetical protein
MGGRRIWQCAAEPVASVQRTWGNTPALIAELPTTGAADIIAPNASGSERINAVVSIPLVQNIRQVSARENMKQSGLKLLYERTYPPATTDFAPIVRAIAAANPDLVVVCSYPPDSVGMVRAVNELGFKPKAIGGAMVGLQSTAIKTRLGPQLHSATGSGGDEDAR